MKYCYRCGTQLYEEAVICPKFGCAQSGNGGSAVNAVNDAGSAGWAVLGFFFPLIGSQLPFLVAEINSVDFYKRDSKTRMSVLFDIGPP